MRKYFMRNLKLSVMALSMVLLIVTIPTAEGKGAGSEHAGTERLLCTNAVVPNLTLEKEIITSEEYIGTVTVTPNHGICIYKNENRYQYEMDYVPVYYKAELYDKEFKELLEERIIMYEMSDFEIEYSGMYNAVEYEVVITTKWMDHEERCVIKTTTLVFGGGNNV